ncbi:uncharacterized protein RSE6_14314 [Rhynchosporium secalis]|uniref:Uncharacterized protein n=1 Tax=Rhynchosporium secalis TaxID=38038 RepID=A0A1E1MV10_RHYSE|nr:uncharacterized protein RSE6_14314 [Rhynchosporium secalis]
MFAETKAQLAIRYLEEHLQEITSINTDTPEKPQLLNQELLYPILRATKALPHPASDLIVKTLLPRLCPTPSIDLIDLILSIFSRICILMPVRLQINKWLHNFTTTSPALLSDPADYREILICLYLYKAEVVSRGNYLTRFAVTTIGLALDTMKECAAVPGGDLRLLDTARQLSLLLFREKREEAWKLWDDCISTLERDEGGGSQERER